MRMWMIPTKYICDKHLLGEHVELHMLVGSINKKKNIKGFLDKKLVDPQSINARHYEIVSEMNKRGMNHKSDLPKFETDQEAIIDVVANYKDLADRCPKCKELMK